MRRFFAALICCPDTVPPSEYLPEIWGGDMTDNEAFSDQAELQKFLDLVMRHWNAVVHALHSEDQFSPLLAEDDAGVSQANDWAQGFLRGMELRRADWSELFDDDNHAGSLVPILALANEHHADPEMRPYKEPMSTERREQLIIGIAANLSVFCVPSEACDAASERKGNASALGAEGRSKRSLPVWVRTEVQEVLREGDVALSKRGRSSMVHRAFSGELT
jgi:yecA family protein